MGRFAIVSGILFLAAVSGVAAGLAHPLGLVETGQEVLFDLSYTHKGAGVEAVELVPDCSCISILQQPALLDSGETVVIPCAYRFDKPGRIAAKVEIKGGAVAGLLGEITVEGVAAPRDWLVEAKEWATEKTDAAMLVDTRSEAAFAKVHIPGAISVPYHALSRRTDLKKVALVLYDEGIDITALLAEATALRDEGFIDVKVLRSGLAGWLRDARPVQGLVGSRVPYLMLTSWQFASLGHAAPWGLISVAGPVPGHEAECLVVSDVKALPALLQNEFRRRPGFTWLVVSEDRNDYETLEAGLSPELRNRIYYSLHGQVEWAQQERIAALAAVAGGVAQTETVTAGTKLAPPQTGRRGCSSCGKK